MNSTFMFGEDRFTNEEDFSIYYHHLGGKLSATTINSVIRKIYHRLDTLYPQEAYRHCFPGVKSTLAKVIPENFTTGEISKIVDTFAFHEMGTISDEYVEVLHRLKRNFQLALVIDIWSPKQRWCDLFSTLGINELFSATSFSSDHGMVKPSARPFELVVETLGVDKQNVLVVGDSARRDLGGATAAGLDCVLIGGAKDPSAAGHYQDLIEFSNCY